jgi:4-amino-4-deoxy-L-arabinose transferase-like glycosyltransferase
MSGPDRGSVIPHSPSASREPRASSGILAVGLAGVLLLTAACWPMQRHALPAWACAALVAGLLAWLAVAWKSADGCEALPTLSPAPASLGRLAAGFLVSLALAALSWTRTASGRFETVGVAAWLGALVIWFWGWSQRAGDAPRNAGPEPAPSPRARLAVGLALLAILAVGAFFRFHDLSEVPPHPGSDHAEDLLNVEQLARGERPVFFPTNTGQAPLPFYFEYLLVRLGLPLDYLMLKISTALVGMLAIPAMYVVGRELGGAPLGLVAAALCAWSKWPTLGARRGLTFAWAVFPAALFLAAILRYMRRGNRPSALSAGFWLGLGQYGYNAFKIVPAMVPLAFGLCLFDRRWKGRRGRLWLDGVLVAATSLLVFLPLLQYMLQRPEDFWYRAMTRAGSQERPLPGPPAALFAGNLGRMALAFHFRGDQAWINTVAEEPFLDPVTGAFLLAGLVVAGVLILRGSTRWTLVVLSLFVLTLASTLALAFPVENPGINRAAVAIPSVLLLAGLPAVWLLRRARERGRLALAATGGVLALLGALSIRENYEGYFVRFRDEQVRILEPTMDLVRVMREYRDTRGIPFDNVYLLNTTNWIDGRCIDFEIGDRLWSGLHDVPSDAPVPLIRDRPLLLFVHGSDRERRKQLAEAFPEGEEKLVVQPFRDRSYYTYFVPR